MISSSNVKKVIRALCWISPILALIRDTRDAVSDGYHEKLLEDPGHKRVRTYDKMVITFTWVVGLTLVYFSANHYGQSLGVDFFDESVVLISLLFTYLANIYLAVLLYVNSFILFVYNKKRAGIIRKINERAGVW